jgi:hypothetical protein
MSCRDPPICPRAYFDAPNEQVELPKVDSHEQTPSRPAAAVMLVIAAAFALDCVQLAKQACYRIGLADQELVKHEQRLVKVLNGSAESTPEVHEAITAYEASADPPARHAAYDQLVAAFRQTMGTAADPTNPLDRKFMDDAAGAINRRELAEPAYDAEMSTYRAYMSGVRRRRCPLVLIAAPSDALISQGMSWPLSSHVMLSAVALDVGTMECAFPP